MKRADILLRITESKKHGVLEFLKDGKMTAVETAVCEDVLCSRMVSVFRLRDKQTTSEERAVSVA